MHKKITIYFEDGSLITINNAIDSETLSDGLSVTTPDKTYIINYTHVLCTVLEEEV